MWWATLHEGGADNDDTVEYALNSLDELQGETVTYHVNVNNLISTTAACELILSSIQTHPPRSKRMT